MSRDILAIDVGTTALKLGVFTPDLQQKSEATRAYEVNLYGQGRADIEPEKWWSALLSCCAEVTQHLGNVGVVAMSVTTPGLTPMAADGRAIGPAILFFDGRSNAQAAAIRTAVGQFDHVDQGASARGVGSGGKVRSHKHVPRPPDDR
ncbi:MAG: FGGY family carbohydrate kinase [Armatimonadetes bacterium]|nr:FGGY family carbohydrate kinase [Armatimonadota bacterium]